MLCLGWGWWPCGSVTFFGLDLVTEPSLNFRSQLLDLQGAETVPGKKGKSNLDFAFPHVYHSKFLSTSANNMYLHVIMNYIPNRKPSVFFPC